MLLKRFIWLSVSGRAVCVRSSNLDLFTQVQCCLACPTMGSWSRGLTSQAHLVSFVSRPVSTPACHRLPMSSCSPAGRDSKRCPAGRVPSCITSLCRLFRHCLPSFQGSGGAYLSVAAFTMPLLSKCSEALWMQMLFYFH